MPGIGFTMASCSAYMIMNGVMIPGVSAGSNQVGASEMWTPQVICPSGAARDGVDVRHVTDSKSATTTARPSLPSNGDRLIVISSRRREPGNCADGAPRRPSSGAIICNSPYTAKLIKGQEDYVYVWALGVEGLGDGSDKLVTVDVHPKSKSHGKVIASVSVGSRGEAHHMGFTDDRRFIWAGGLSEAKIYVFDIATDPAKPKRS